MKLNERQSDYPVKMEPRGQIAYFIFDIRCLRREPDIILTIIKNGIESVLGVN